LHLHTRSGFPHASQPYRTSYLRGGSHGQRAGPADQRQNGRGQDGSQCVGLARPPHRWRWRHALRAARAFLRCFTASAGFERATSHAVSGLGQDAIGHGALARLCCRGCECAFDREGSQRRGGRQPLCRPSRVGAFSCDNSMPHHRPTGSPHAQRPWRRFAALGNDKASENGSVSSSSTWVTGSVRVGKGWSPALTVSIRSTSTSFCWGGPRFVGMT